MLTIASLLLIGVCDDSLTALVGVVVLASPTRFRQWAKRGLPRDRSLKVVCMAATYRVNPRYLYSSRMTRPPPSMHYYDTLIAVADDCPVAQGTIPPARSKPTVAWLQYDMLTGNPYRYTQEDVLFNTWLERQDFTIRSPVQIAELRDDFFARAQACLRSSPLPKSYGWGLLFDHKGRIALCPMESKEYRRIVEGEAGGIEVLNAFRSSKS